MTLASPIVRADAPTNDRASVGSAAQANGHANTATDGRVVTIANPRANLVTVGPTHVSANGWRANYRARNRTDVQANAGIDGCRPHRGAERTPTSQGHRCCSRQQDSETHWGLR